MDDAIIPVALALHSSPGVYAILLGSGVSRSAGIPTGWELTLDLVSQVATAKEEAPDDPSRWWTDTFGAPPAYSDVLEQLARSKEDQQSLLRRYFEPSDEDEIEGAKTPTTAHQKVAALVKAGCVRVIVTTNFDRLMESTTESRVSWGTQRSFRAPQALFAT